MNDYRDDIAESTRIIGKRPGASKGNHEEATRAADRDGRPGGNPPPRRGWDPTQMIRGTERAPSSTEDNATRVVGPSRRGGSSAQHTRVVDEGALPGELGEVDALQDPVVGWLVIVAGPGRGNAIPVYYGQNSIGRGREERIRIDYGDQQISRESHCFIVYEPEEREFVVLRGTAKGLTYLNGKVILEPRPIHSGELLRIGITTLRFVAFCGPDFDWQDGPLVAPRSNTPQAQPEADDAPAPSE